MSNIHTSSQKQVVLSRELSTSGSLVDLPAPAPVMSRFGKR